MNLPGVDQLLSDIRQLEILATAARRPDLEMTLVTPEEAAMLESFRAFQRGES